MPPERRTRVIVVAALTYRRPETLPALLRGLTSLERPEGWEVRLLIVDNDPCGSARNQVDQFGTALEGISYVIEAEPGIPAARNRALREAIDWGGELLCFIDDDEQPEQDWLIRLVSHRQATGAVLIGGPQRRTIPQTGLSRWQRFIGASLIARRTIMERRCRRRAELGQTVMIGTSNWMGDLAWLRQRDLWFDSAYRDSGGEDAAFMLDVLRLDGHTSWCASAIVTEPIEPSRLTLRYQFRRSFEQGVVLARLNPRPVPHLILRQGCGALAGLGVIVAPVFGVASYAIGLHLLASALGHFAHLWGASATAYAQSDVAS